MGFWRLRVDDPSFGLESGDVLEGEPLPADPGGPDNPEGRISIICRLRDNFLPGCNMPWVYLEPLGSDDLEVHRLLRDRGVAYVQDPAIVQRPALSVLAASAVIAQREIADLGLARLYRPYYAGYPHALRVCRRFVVLPSFDERVCPAAEAAEWEETLAYLRGSPTTVEIDLDDVRRAIAESGA